MYRRQFMAWLPKAKEEGRLRQWVYLSFSHSDPNRRYCDAFDDAITDYRGTRQERINGLLRDFRTLRGYLAAEARGHP